ncbi:MAG: tetratricopeptide repeat protein [Planctomycetota bacterium]|nr:tetratricopeptide repeat protein [Planctomycetota bacterium]
MTTRRIRNARMFVAAAVIGLAGCQNDTSIFGPLNRSIARGHIKRGDRLRDNGDFDSASAAYRRAVARDERNADAHARLAAVQCQIGNHESAAEHYAAAVRYDPENSVYARALADALYRASGTAIKRFEILRAAARAYCHASTLDPDSLPIALGLARSYRQLGELDQAIDVLESARRIDPSASLIHLELGAIHDDRFDYKRALAEFNTAVRLDPDDPVAHFHCGAVNLTLADLDAGNPIYRQRAAAHLRRSIEIDPHQPLVQDMLRVSAPPQLRAVTAAAHTDE